MDSSDVEFLEGGNYINFSTRKRSGDWVDTPVWFAADGDSYFVFAAGDSGKVKRLRNFSAARIAPCTVTGTLTGDWLDTQAFLLADEAGQARALAALRRKYGWKMITADVFSTLTGKMKKRAYIRIQRAAG
jgi:PPOX class probable F420-dependent enzyme